MPPTCPGMLAEGPPKPVPPPSFASEPNAELTWAAKLQAQQDVMHELIHALDQHQKLVADCAVQQQKAVDALRKKLDMETLSLASKPQLHAGEFPTFITSASMAPNSTSSIVRTEPRREGMDSFSSVTSSIGQSVVLDLDDGKVPPVHGDIGEHSEPSGVSGTESSADICSSLGSGAEHAVGEGLPKRRKKKARRSTGVDRSETLESKLMGQADMELHQPVLSMSPAGVVKVKAGWRCTKPLRSAVMSQKFEMMCTAVLLANVLTMVARIEIEGLLAGEKLGELANAGVTRNSLDVMEVMELFFTMWFTIELLVRLWAFGWHAVSDALGAFDAFIVVSTLIDVVFSRLLETENRMNLASARMLRLLKVLKIFRTFKAASAFTELRILLRTVLRSTMALMWTMVVLTMIIVAASNLVAQMLNGFIVGEDGDYELRVWVFQHYGTASRSAYTMLEATLSGGWPNYARRLVMEVSPLWAIFWISYVFAIIFAVIRVMGALFLAASLKAASEDDDMQALRRMKDSKEWTKKLMKVFWPEFTEAKGGLLHSSKGTRYPARYMTRGHLESTLANDSARYKLAVYGFEPMEFKLLFDILHDDDDKVDRNAFLKAALRIKGGVKAIDVIEILREVEVMKKTVTELASHTLPQGIGTESLAAPGAGALASDGD